MPPVDFIALQDTLRNIAADRIRAGQMTGLALAQKTGFRQAHISNFLNRRRGLSIEAMNRVLEVLGLTVVDLIDQDEINRRATVSPPSEGVYRSVLLVEAPAAIHQPVITRASVLDILKFEQSFLHRLRADMASARQDWIRFVLVKADAANGLAMYPRMNAGATLLVDRHYNSLRPYRRGSPNIYAVNDGGEMLVRYVELQGHQLLLRPHAQQSPLAAIGLSEGKSFADYIIGRICHVAFET
jgi:transcriptional regulator with XRE-family HTH domain